MSGYSVQFAQMGDAVLALDAATSRMDQNLDNLEMAVEAQLVNWEGTAKAAYWENKKIWNAAQTRMFQILSTAATTLQTAGDNYSITERMVTDRQG